jgi:polysaccharide export outer membrane protein
MRWKDAAPINFEPLRHGEWIGPVRLPAVLQYRIRVGDELQFVFIKVPAELTEPYRLMVGDELSIRSVTDDRVAIGDLVKGSQIQQDGKLYLSYIEPVQAAGLTIPELRAVLEKQYSRLIKNPAIDVMPVRTNTKLEYLNTAVSNFQTNGGQNISGTVNPDGNLQLPLIGSVRMVGMTLDEIKREVNLHYRQRGYLGVEIEPRLTRQAPHFIYVMGEVNKPGRIELLGPTTVTQALAMAEGIKVGGNMRQIVVFRRAEDWRLMATMLDIKAELWGKRPNPADEIWIRDSDLIIVPPQPIKVFDNWVKLVFTDGIYGIAPAVLFSNNGNSGIIN